MRTLIVLALTSLCLQLAKAQIKAVTETGDEVVLYDNGNWEYVNSSNSKDAVIPTNDKAFIRSESSTFLVKSNKLNMGIWINPKTWSFSKGSQNEEHEFQFQKKGEDLYALVISEKLPIPLEQLKGIVFENAKTAAPDVKLTHEEYRIVNGIKVLVLQMVGTIQGLRFTYYGYYYSNSNGTMQLLTYTGENLFNSYYEDIETFLNGLVEL